MASPFLKAPQIKILTALRRFRYLSAYQVTRLLYAPTSLKHVQALMAALTKGGWVDVIKRPRGEVGGRPLHIYTPSAQGWRYLKQKPRKVTRSIDRLLHTLDANDLVILAHEYASVSNYTVSHYLTEIELKAQPAAGVSPDGAVLLEDEHRQYPLIFEVDRDTEEREVFQAKLQNLVIYSQGAYKAHLDSEYLTIAFLLTVDEPRRFHLMLNWCRAAVPEPLWPMFLFGSFQPETADPVDVFTQPLWITPTSTELVPLVHLVH